MTKLKAFQRDGVSAIYQFRGRALLADEQGLGKTIQSLYWLTRIPSRRPVVIVTPASMKYTWQAEAMMHFGLRSEVLEGHCKRKRTVPPAPVVILNYNLLKSWMPSLLKWKAKAIVLDEVHFIKNRTSQRTKLCHKLVKGADSVLGLSGTPLTNRPVELWSILKAIKPQLFPDFQEYAWRYCKPRHTLWGWKYDGSTNEAELHRILRRKVMIRRLKKDVLPELPDKSRRIISFHLKDRREYVRAEKDFLNWLGSVSPARARRAKRSQALAKVGYLMRLVAELKLPWVEQWIVDFLQANPGKKLVAFSMNTFVIEHLQERFRDRCVVIDGSVTGRKREEAKRKFQTNRRCDLLFGNWIAAGVGITLTAAHNVAALDLPWTAGDMLQGEDRAHRIGQKEKVTVFYPIALETVEEKLIQGLRKKVKVLDAILDGKRSAEDFDIFDELITQIQS